MKSTTPTPTRSGNQPVEPPHSRAETARFALASSLWARGENPREPDDEAVTDLLADLRHLCHERGIDYLLCDRFAALHFDEETGG